MSRVLSHFPPKDGRKSASSIPTITNLRDTLNYGDQSIPRHSSFVMKLRQFRQEHCLHDPSLSVWKSPESQQKLAHLATSFLDGHKNGEIYWPDDPAAANYNSLKYSTHQSLIHEIVKQLIFKENLQQSRNKKYKRRTRTIENSIPRRTKIVTLKMDSAILRSLNSPSILRGSATGSTMGRNGEPRPGHQSRKKDVACSRDSSAGINFNYRVVLCPTPVYKSKRWYPKGLFLEKSLSELINELPFGHKEGIRALKIRLNCPGFDVEEAIGRGQEDSYNSTKKEFIRVVKECRKKHIKANSGGILAVDFTIEAVMGGDCDEQMGIYENSVLLF
ncbi:hypothetical protein PMIN03_012580 [Paraphaeosphaeria minitans]